jgi:hypothetical protein
MSDELDRKFQGIKIIILQLPVCECAFVNERVISAAVMPFKAVESLNILV